MPETLHLFSGFLRRIPARFPGKPSFPGAGSLGGGLAVLLVAACLGLGATASFAQGSGVGKLSGTVRDGEGRPVKSANVIIQGTSMGVIADDGGRYSIEGIPAGIYTVVIKHIAYVEQKIEDVIIESDRARRLDSTLQDKIVAEFDVFVIEEDKYDKLKKEHSSTVRVIDTKEQSRIRAINTTEEALTTQAGVVQLGNALFIRGGRSSEVKTVVDGMPVSDAFSGSSTLDVALSSQDGLNLLTGGFDAEYGNAQSGIIEIATKEGGDEYSGNLKFMTDDFGAPDKTYFNYDNLSFGVGGPVPYAGDRWKFYLSGEGVFQDTYLKTLEVRPARKLRWNDSELASIRDRQNNAVRGQAKLTHVFTGGKGRKISGEYLFSRSKNDWYHHAFSRVGYWSESEEQWWFEPLDSTYTYYSGPEHLTEQTNENDQYKLVYTHPLNDTSVLTFRSALFRTIYQESVGGQSPAEYVSFQGNDDERDPDNLFFAVVGDYPSWEDRESRQYTFRGDFQNRFDAASISSHELKTGVTFNYHEVRKDARNYPDEDNPLGNFPNRYEQNAVDGVYYIQDKLRYKKTMVMNVGLRFDFFDPGADAVRISNQRVLTLQKPTSGTSFFERWRAQVSPRLGMSYPISDRDVLHFAYGRYFQLPDLEYIFDYSENPNAGNQLVGNAFLEPETTISYEFGVRRQLSDRVYLDATVFFKDIFGLIGTEELEAENEREQNQFASIIYTNKDYGSVRGFELSLEKSFADYWQGGLSYTLSRASGSSSDVNQGAIVATEGQDREPIKEIPLDWDRAHVMSAYLNFSDTGVWTCNFDFQIATGAPTTPYRLGQRSVEAEDKNSIRLPHTMTLSMRANKLYALYGQEFRLFLEGRNILDRQNVNVDRPYIWPTPANEYYREYYTEFGELGGAYNLKDTVGATEDILIPLNDPRVYSEPRVFRMGVAYEW